jgi:hypothetical protein
MRWLFAPLLMLITRSSESELAANVEFQGRGTKYGAA